MCLHTPLCALPLKCWAFRSYYRCVSNLSGRPCPAKKRVDHLAEEEEDLSSPQRAPLLVSYVHRHNHPARAVPLRGVAPEKPCLEAFPSPPWRHQGEAEHWGGAHSEAGLGAGSGVERLGAEALAREMIVDLEAQLRGMAASHVAAGLAGLGPQEKEASTGPCTDLGAVGAPLEAGSLCLSAASRSLAPAPCLEAPATPAHGTPLAGAQGLAAAPRSQPLRHTESAFEPPTHTRSCLLPCSHTGSGSTGSGGAGAGKPAVPLLPALKKKAAPVQHSESFFRRARAAEGCADAAEKLLWSLLEKPTAGTQGALGAASADDDNSCGEEAAPTPCPCGDWENQCVVPQMVGANFNRLSGTQEELAKAGGYKNDDGQRLNASTSGTSGCTSSGTGPLPFPEACSPPSPRLKNASFLDIVKELLGPGECFETWTQPGNARKDILQGHSPPLPDWHAADYDDSLHAGSFV